MTRVYHRFLNHQIDINTEILIVGTFNPETENNEAEFFYGRSRNYLWRLLPTAFGESNLKAASKQEKLNFISKYKIDLIDLIEEIKVDLDQEDNYADDYIDNKVTRWRNIIAIIDTLPNLKMVCLTRKTLSGIPNMSKQIHLIQNHCEDKGIKFERLSTPARYYSEAKQIEWNNFLLK
jgi:G:T/U-mismatch repair DNA glycosylase